MPLADRWSYNDSRSLLDDQSQLHRDASLSTVSRPSDFDLSVRCIAVILFIRISIFLSNHVSKSGSIRNWLPIHIIATNHRLSTAGLHVA
jgi:hypothetical protein